tara:strand:+ start:182 stop:454 length:273 start_codon:yes stop_codon:yes gene_type:complete
MKSIDIKSLLIGILGTALVMVLMGQSSVQKQYDVECVPDYKQDVGDRLEIQYVYCHKFDLSKPINNKLNHKGDKKLGIMMPLFEFLDNEY